MSVDIVTAPVIVRGRTTNRNGIGRFRKITNKIA